MSLATELAYYGINPNDPVYDLELHDPFARGPFCGICHRHRAINRRWRCDLEAARAAEMDDPRHCAWCCRCFDLASCVTPDCLNSWVGTCGDCQARHEAQWEAFKARPVRPCGSRELSGFPLRLAGLHPGGIQGMTDTQIDLLRAEA